MQTTRTPYSISFMATVLLLLLFACHSTVANAAVALGATRVIYPANQKQVLLPVTNNDPASVYLIQSWIENAGDQKDTQFVITPPLFSMQGKKEIRQKNMCRTTAHAHHFRIVWPTHQLSLMLVSNICHSPFRKFMLAEWLAAMFLLICGKKE